MRSHYVLVCAVVTVVGGCSFLVDTNISQCQTDVDCSRFGAICNVEQHVCVAPGAASADAGHTETSELGDANSVDINDVELGTSDATTASTPDAPAADAPTCVGPSGCFACKPTTEAELMSQCTDSVCVPFDNSRVTLLTADGHLRPLP